AVLTAGPLPGQVRAIGFDTFASSLVAVDASGAALTPCITYADTRCQPQIERLAATLDVDDLHERTGARLHSSYTAPRLAWLREEHPEVFARTERFMALGEYARSEEHTSELQSRFDLVCRLLLEKKKK